jgi:hypothetical protein
METCSLPSWFPRICLHGSLFVSIFPSNGSACHIAPSLRLLIPSNLSVCHRSFLSPEGCACFQLLQLFGAKLPRAAGAPTFPAPTLCAISFYISEGTDPSTVSNPWFFCNPTEESGVHFAISSPKAFLSNLLDVLSILRCSCHLVPGSFIPFLHSSFG